MNIDDSMIDRELGRYPLMPDVLGVPFDAVESIYLVGGQTLTVRSAHQDTLDVRCEADQFAWYIIWRTRAHPVQRHTGGAVTRPPIREHRVVYNQIAGVSRIVEEVSNEHPEG